MYTKAPNVMKLYQPPAPDKKKESKENRPTTFTTRAEHVTAERTCQDIRIRNKYYDKIIPAC